MREMNSLSVRERKIRNNKSDSYGRQMVLAGVVTAVFYIIALITSSKYPLGKYTFLLGDLEAQYAPFLFFYKQQLLNLSLKDFVSNFTYSFSMGAGKNIMGTFGYYLASPLNFLVFFFNASQVNEFIMLLVGIKLSLAASFMTLFIHERSSDRKTSWPVLFGIMYAFSSYTMAYMFNIMWLDGYALLPLLLWCIEKFIRDRRAARIIPVLLILFVSNYYTAYMVGIYSFFYLIVRILVLNDMKNIRSFFPMVGKFIMTAICCALTACVILIPVGLDTITNSDPISYPGAEEIVNYSAIDLVDQIFLGYPGSFSEVMPSNLPFVFISLMVTFLCIVYFTSGLFRGTERKIHAVCLALVYMSLTVKLIDKAWQVFDDPNWFQHRESFVFMPLFLVIAYKTLEKIKEVENRDIVKALGIACGALFVAQSFGAMKARDNVFLFNLFFVGLLALVFMGMKRTKWPEQLKNMNSLLNIILVIMVSFEVVAIAPIMSAGVACLSVYFGEAGDYVNQVQVYSDFADFQKEQAGGFRLENNQIGIGLETSYTEAAFYSGSHGVTLFNSNSNKMFHRFLKQFGYDVNYNYFSAGYTFEAPDTDAFLSVGRVITPDRYSCAAPMATDNYGLNLTMYSYDNVLPLAFAVDSGATDFDFYSLESDSAEKNYFEFRNDWYRSMFPGEFTSDFYYAPSAEPEFEAINATYIDMNDYVILHVDEDAVKSDDDSDTSVFDPDRIGTESVNPVNEACTYYQVNSEISMVLNYVLTVESEDELYVNISVPRLMDECSLYVNGKYFSGWSQNSFYSQVLRLGSYNIGDRVQVSIVSDAKKVSILDVNFAYFNDELFNSQFSRISLAGVDINQIDNGVVRLTSDLNSDEIILTSIPYEKGWTLYVDGQEQEIIPYQDALIAIDAGAGSHDIELRFTAPGTGLGAVCTIIGVVGLAIIVLMDKKQFKVTK